MTVWRMRIACWIPKATDTHSEYEIFIAFSSTMVKQKQLNIITVLFWVITLRVVLMSYRRFVDNLSVPSSRVKKMGPIGCLETSARNYHFSQRNDSEERRSHLHRGGNLKSSMAQYCVTRTMPVLL
jgi:hypothetical protein